MTTATMSTKGQIVIPSDVRDALGWSAGTVLEVERRGDSVVLRPARPFPRTSIDDVVGCLPWRGPAKTLEEMEGGIARGARRSRDDER